MHITEFLRQAKLNETQTPTPEDSDFEVDLAMLEEIAEEDALMLSELAKR